MNSPSPKLAGAWPQDLGSCARGCEKWPKKIREDNSMVKIDYINNLEITDDEAKKRHNELLSLSYLAKGLDFLYNQVGKLEAQIAENLGKDIKVSMFGNAPQLKGIPQDLVACAFHWYAVTICNYVKMVGWLAYSEDSTKATDYLKQVVPPVKLWRDKVGAHFARISPRKDDTPADLAMSVISPIPFDDDAFYAGSLRLSLSEGGILSTSRPDMRWSLTHTHRNLIPRYWPSKLD